MKLVHLPLLCAMLVLAGCSSANKAGMEPAKLVSFNEVAKFKVRWDADVGDSGPNLLQPAIGDDAVYGVSAKGRMTRLQRATGKKVWRIDTGIRVTAGVGSGEGMLLLGGEKGDVLAYDEAGKLLWRSKVSSEVLSVPQVSAGTVVVRSGDGRIVGLKASDGTRVWMYERSTPALVVRSHAGVTLQRGVAFAGFAGGKLAAISVKDGTLLWETSVSQPRGNTELERISDITSNPVVDDEQVCAISFQGRVACFDVAQGSPLWNRDISSEKGMMLLRKYLYLSDAGDAVQALDKVSGSTLWKNDQLSWRDTSAPYALGDHIVVGDAAGYLHGMNREDGSFVARIKLESSPIKGAPLELDDGLLVQTRSGGLYSLSLH